MQTITTEFGSAVIEGLSVEASEAEWHALIEFLRDETSDPMQAITLLLRCAGALIAQVLVGDVQSESSDAGAILVELIRNHYAKDPKFMVQRRMQ
jgi:hypothetical protein